MSKTIEFDIEGMTCAACSARIEKVLNRMDGVEATVNLPLETARVSISDAYDDQAIIEKIRKIGYEATVKQAPHATKSNRRMLYRFVIAAVLSLPLLASMLTHIPNSPFHLPFLMNPWLQFALATPVQFIIGAPFYIGAYKSLRSGSANMDVLVALGTSAAYFYSVAEMLFVSDMPHLYFETSAILITLVLLGKVLEDRAKQQTTGAIKSLLSLQAKEAIVLEDGQERIVSIEAIQAGMVLLVKPGNKIPTDGIVRAGDAYLDESMLTGESVPVHKTVGASVIGGTLNTNGSLQIEATKIGQATVLAQIIRVVEQAQTEKAPIQRQADRISGVFVPIVVAIALLTLAAWWMFTGSFAEAIRPAIAVLVIACPCALGLATPTSIMVGTGKGAERGILFKGGAQLENLQHVDAVVFDKTGTLTVGRPVVVETFGTETALDFAAALERQSEHPLARAITAERDVVFDIEQFHVESGRGITGQIMGHDLIVGSARMIQERNIALPDWTSLGATLVYVAVDGEVAAGYAIRDALKDSAKETIQQLRETKDVYLLTGDRREVADHLAEELGLDRAFVFADVLPVEKADVIQSLQQTKRVAMVGDGINDAPALVTADVGIALGSGTDVALEAADVTLLGHDLKQVLLAIELSEQTMKNIRQNLVFALGYNTIGIPVAFLGLLAPWLAGAAMAFSSVSVVTNALRLKRTPLSEGGTSS
ncbi:heavy metal translocating P-type ATPase [Exiguobacterium acetylicum]|uniref:heavy metal translocating P-type ATPase n=1 Tax=Exiguobacterium acetylicum TaxID=41170 RepID=UPI0027DF94AF|nr:heavy metal translocating P-type ATPase [Exiguobacterium acetylicum]MDQ6468193.1 heavy metal translocating P-type ATPase [Exiguobacterium acetylicum]